MTVENPDSFGDPPSMGRHFQSELLFVFVVKICRRAYRASSGVDSEVGTVAADQGICYVLVHPDVRIRRSDLENRKSGRNIFCYFRLIDTLAERRRIIVQIQNVHNQMKLWNQNRISRILTGDRQPEADVFFSIDQTGSDDVILAVEHSTQPEVGPFAVVFDATIELSVVAFVRISSDHVTHERSDFDVFGNLRHVRVGVVESVYGNRRRVVVDVFNCDNYGSLRLHLFQAPVDGHHDQVTHRILFVVHLPDHEYLPRSIVYLEYLSEIRFRTCTEAVTHFTVQAGVAIVRDDSDHKRHRGRVLLQFRLVRTVVERREVVVRVQYDNWDLQGAVSWKDFPRRKPRP